MFVTFMAAKTVALDPEAYALLKQRKRGGESFSDVVRRQFHPPTKLSDLAGTLSNVPNAVWREIEVDRRRSRKADDRRQTEAERRRPRK